MVLFTAHGDLHRKSQLDIIQRSRDTWELIPVGPSTQKLLNLWLREKKSQKREQKDCANQSSRKSAKKQFFTAMDA